ncbi:ABC transporter permease [Pseudomonas sp. LRF_L74]|uniref:ABC transporter permease n=1 Tax=Pseudomonas sp. LRF_L74 TaxID=3369422 RepID=UPI003F5E1E0C
MAGIDGTQAVPAVKARPALATRLRGRYRRGPVANLALAWLVPLLLLGLWWLSAERQWLSLQTLPPPGQVFDTLGAMLRSGELWDHLSISLLRVLGGFALGASLGLALGFAMGLSAILRELLYPTFRLLACVPLLGWLPLLMLLLGIDEALKVVLIAKAALIPATLNTYQGLRNVPKQYLELARVYRFGRWQILWRVLLPGAFPAIWSGLRYGLTHCWLVLVLVELLAASEGLGYLMSNGQQLMQMDVLLVAVLVVGAIGFTLDKLLAAIERHLLRWRHQEQRS